MDSQLWNGTLSRLLSQMKKNKCVGLAQSLQENEFQASLKDLRDKYNSSKVHDYLNRITPFINYIHSFQKVVGSLAPVNTEIPGLIFGAISAVLVCAAEHGEHLNTSTQMLQDITRTLVQCDRYMRMLDENPKLSNILNVLYENYVGFCIELAIFLKRRPVWNIMHLSWRSIKEKLKNTKECIERQTRLFKMECKVSVDTATIQGLNTIQKAMPGLQRTSTAFVPFHSLKYGRNPKFVGREMELNLIDAAIRPMQTGLQSCAVHGLAGVGKSQVAAEYTHRFGSDFDYIFWLPAEEPIALASAFSSLDDKLQLGAGTTDQKSMIEKVKSWLERVSKWLLVFDNAEDWHSISPYWPVTGRGSILVTTQNPAIAQFTTRDFGLPNFSAEDSCTLFFKHRDGEVSRASAGDVATVSMLSNDVGGLPMAIAHMAGYVTHSQLSLKSFRALFEKNLEGSIIWNAGSMATTAFHDGPLGTLWDIAIGSLTENSRKLLDITSFLNPEEIQEELLLGNHPEAKQVIQFNATITDLRSRSLINRHHSEKQSYISVHRALQRNVLYRLYNDPARNHESVGHAIELVRQAFPHRDKFETPDHHKWHQYERYLPHVIRLQSFTSEAGLDTNHMVMLADVLTDAGHYLWHRGEMNSARSVLETADIACRSIPEEASAVTRASALLGLVAVGLATGASMGEQILQQNHEVVRLRSSYPGKDEQTSGALLSNAFHDLGVTYLEMENYNAAEENLDKSLSIKQQLLSEAVMPFEFATEYEDMAYVRLSQGRTADALRLIEDAVRVARIDEDANRSVIFQFVFDWAVILLNCGRYEDALEKAEEALRGRKKVLGGSAIHTLNSVYWVANVLFHLGRFVESEETLRAVVESSQSSQWPLETVTRARYRLMQVVAALGRETEAAALEDDIRAVYAKWKDSGDAFPEPSARSIAIFDKRVSIYFGRSTGQLSQSPSSSPATQ